MAVDLSMPHCYSSLDRVVCEEAKRPRVGAVVEDPDAGVQQIIVVQELTLAPAHI